MNSFILRGHLGRGFLAVFCQGRGLPCSLRWAWGGSAISASWAPSLSSSPSWPSLFNYLFCTRFCRRVSLEEKKKFILYFKSLETVACLAVVFTDLKILWYPSFTLFYESGRKRFWFFMLESWSIIYTNTICLSLCLSPSSLSLAYEHYWACTCVTTV